MVEPRIPRVLSSVVKAAINTDPDALVKRDPVPPPPPAAKGIELDDIAKPRPGLAVTRAPLNAGVTLSAPGAGGVMPDHQDHGPDESGVPHLLGGHQELPGQTARLWRGRPVLRRGPRRTNQQTDEENDRRDERHPVSHVVPFGCCSRKRLMAWTASSIPARLGFTASARSKYPRARSGLPSCR